MIAQALEQYNKALKQGQRYYRLAMARGEHPYLPVLDEILDESTVAARMDLGVINVPLYLICGTKTAGRTTAMAGNFMPLLGPETEFAAKWIGLCSAHLEASGISDPIRCYEYLGRFYVQEGNKRVSVMKSFDAPYMSARVIRLVPEYSPELGLYFEFMHFYSLARLYGVALRQSGMYAKLQALLGLDEDQQWTEDQRRSFSAGFVHFSKAFKKVNAEGADVTPAEALLGWLEVYSFAEIKKHTGPELVKLLSALWPDIKARNSWNIALSTQPDEKQAGLISRFLSLGHSEHITCAFIYGFDPAHSAWTQAHDQGRLYLEKKLGAKVTTRVYIAHGRDFMAPLETAVEEGARLIFATTPSMIEASRRLAAKYPEVKVLVCALSLPYTGVRMYYGRMYEGKFITGAIAGAMAKEDLVGFVANYPILGMPAAINAFALGVRMTNPRAKVLLRWSCTESHPVKSLMDMGVTVISNRDGGGKTGELRQLEMGTYRIEPGGELQPLAAPIWNWGRLYEHVVLSIFNGSWANVPSSKAINYWWGMSSGAVDVELSPCLPEGIRSLATILRRDLMNDALHPFRTKILDQQGILRCDGERGLSPEEIMTMDWLCQNVSGSIPGYERLIPQSREIVRLLGVYRDSIPPVKEGQPL